MAKFEIELPDDVAELVNTADRQLTGLWDASVVREMAETVISALSKDTGELTRHDLAACARMFNAMGHVLQSRAGTHRNIISDQERDRRTGSAKRAYETRKARRAAGLPTDSAIARAKRIEQNGCREGLTAEPVMAPHQSSNVVSLSAFRNAR